MSASCESFQANAWKKDFCSYCFKSREEHSFLVDRNTSSSVQVQAIKSRTGSILKKNGSRKKKREVKFPDQVVQVIGYNGGQEVYSEDEDDTAVSDGASASDSEDDDENCTEEELQIKIITEKNTTFNSISRNLLRSELSPSEDATFDEITEAVSEVLTLRQVTGSLPTTSESDNNNNPSRNSANESELTTLPNSETSSLVPTDEEAKINERNQSTTVTTEATTGDTVRRGDNKSNECSTTDSFYQVPTVNAVVSASPREKKGIEAFGKHTVKSFYSNLDAFKELSCPNDIADTSNRSDKRSSTRNQTSGVQGLEEKLQAIGKSLEETRHDSQVLLSHLSEKNKWETRKKSESRSEPPCLRLIHDETHQMAIKSDTETKNQSQGRLYLSDTNKSKNHFSIRKLLRMKRTTGQKEFITSQQDMNIFYPKSKTYIFQSFDYLNNSSVQATAIKSIEINHVDYSGNHRETFKSTSSSYDSKI